MEIAEKFLFGFGVASLFAEEHLLLIWVGFGMWTLVLGNCCNTPNSIEY